MKVQGLNWIFTDGNSFFQTYFQNPVTTNPTPASLESLLKLELTRIEGHAKFRLDNTNSTEVFKGLGLV